MVEHWPPERLVVRPLSTKDAEQIARWRYEGPWQVYDSRPEDNPLTAAAGYLAVSGAGGGPLVGFCCFGDEARVPGLIAESGLLDIGVGMNPALVGKGHGLAFGRTVLTHYRQMLRVSRLRAVIQSWNERSLRLTRRLGFVQTGKHICVQDGREVEYVVLTTLPARRSAG